MKTLLIAIFLMAAISIIFSCKKDKPLEDPHNHSLRTKSLDEIRAEISGTWNLKRVVVCGFLGCNEGGIPPGGESISFLTKDTVKRVTNGNINIYEKAVITREFNYVFNDTSYYYILGGGYEAWSFDKVKNDTLVMLDGSNVTNYLTK